MAVAWYINTNHFSFFSSFYAKRPFLQLFPISSNEKFISCVIIPIQEQLQFLLLFTTICSDAIELEMEEKGNNCNRNSAHLIYFPFCLDTVQLKDGRNE